MTAERIALIAVLILTFGDPRAPRFDTARMQAQQPTPTQQTSRRAVDGARMTDDQEAQPSSFALIDRALEANTIDAETAHRYRVFAAFGDTRLPAALRGDNRGMRALPPSVGEVGALLATFSAATRAELEPF